MAILFSKKQKADYFEVRSAGATRRLYSNGVLHSQWNPNRVITGAIWDLLVLPGFFLNSPPKRVLVLGLGGGSVVHMIRHFFPQCVITCVEREPMHIKLARRYFSLPKNVEVIEGDAYAVLAKQKHKYFDWILDDVFQHVSGEPERGTGFDSIFDLYEGALADKGVLSMNTIGAQQLKTLKAYGAAFDHSYVMRHPLYDNAIVSMSRKGRNRQQFFDALMQHSELDTRRKTCRLQVSMRAL